MQMIPVVGLHVTAWTFTSIAFLSTLGRFYIHWQKNKRWRWDDYLNGLALLFLLGFTVTYHHFAPVVYDAQMFMQGLGGKLPTEAEYNVDLRINTANNFLFFSTIYTVKASFLALYWQIFEVSMRFRIAWILISIYTAASFLASFLSIFWQCTSPKHFLDAEWCHKGGSDLELRILWVWCALHVFGDILLMLIPLFMLSRAMMPLTQKIGISAVFCLVFITIAIDILRTVFTLWLNPEVENRKELCILLEPAISVLICALPCYGGLLSKVTKRPFILLVDVVSTSFGLSNKSSESSDQSRNTIPFERD